MLTNMHLISRFWAWLSQLPPAETYDVVVEKGLKVPMPDGVTLLADHYFPRTGDKRPTILIRTPYGRANFSYVGRLFAEPGFQGLIQSCRGTDGSGGQFYPFFQEHMDGIPTVEWIKQQVWFNVMS
jgi:predicted acyl esterase